MADEERIDEAIDRLQRVIALIGEQQAFTERRISALSRFALFDLFVVVLSISVLVIILSIQAPELRHAVANMNRHFGTIADDMYSVRRSMSQMTEDVASLPGIIGQVDSIQSKPDPRACDMTACSPRTSGRCPLICFLTKRHPLGI
jgi:hypothetical protein